MTKPDGVAPEATTDGGASPSWGTWEELILAFAVNRHGTASWDSVASELQKRTSDPNLPLTAHDCRSKYLDLKRRFSVAPNHDSDGGGGRGDVKSGAEESAAPLLEELRRLRVAELRREVERYDLNIESLELKVKRMEEERENSLQEKSASDLENKNMEEKRVVDPEAEPGGGGGGPAVGEEIDKDQLSVNESNSTDPEAEKPKTGEKAAEPAAEGEGLDQAGQTRHEPVEVKTEPDRKSGGEEDSFNGSSNSIEKSDRRGKKKPVGSPSDSDGREEAAKESSDVQSTASRSRKEEEGGGGDKVRRGNTSGDEGEHEDQSRAVKELSAQSQPLIDFLQVLRAHKLGSMFQRRLRSQESSKYQKLILQHVDLETIEKRVRQGRYSGSRAKFFRDLLLVVNNALVFFPSNSPESKAARVIRALVSKEMSKSKSESSSGKQISLQSLSKKDKSADNNSNSNSLMLKPRLPGSLTVCRKRSSISITSNKKGQSSSSPANEKVSKSLDEPKITKKRTRENRLSPASTTKTNAKSNNNSNTTKQQEKGGGSSSDNNSNSKKMAESKKQKRGATNFLSRMKQGSNNGDLLDALKNTPLTGEGTDKKKGVVEKKKEQVTRSRLAKEKESPVKNVGRPPKRAAPPPRKRSENEAPKKRTRKL